MLSKAERQFAASQKLSEGDFFDGRSMGKRARDAEALRSGLQFFVGTPCKAAGHRLRSKAGHCIQCETSKIAYTRRIASGGYVYVAESASGGVFKLGFTSKLVTREKSLRNQVYGGFGDWKMRAHMKSTVAGRIESAASKRLLAHSVVGENSKDGKTQFTKEMFRCSFEIMVAALNIASEGMPVELRKGL